jgi:hypothetical protein
MPAGNIQYNETLTAKVKRKLIWGKRNALGSKRGMRA